MKQYSVGFYTFLLSTNVLLMVIQLMVDPINMFLITLSSIGIGCSILAIIIAYIQNKKET